MSTTGRRLAVLAAVQARPGISAIQLAQRLDTDERTIRRDVQHLRRLGYVVTGTTGRYGGYTLGPGSAVPPLVLDADEATAVALGLRTVALGEDLSEAAITALAKLRATVSARARARMDALARTSVSTEASSSPVPVLVALAEACWRGQAIQIRHRRDDDRPAQPALVVQPLRLVLIGNRWYLVASPDPGRVWRCYAVARIEAVKSLGTRRRAPEPPEDVIVFVHASLAGATRRHLVRLRAHSSYDTVRERIAPSTATLSDEGTSCRIDLTTDDLDWAARWIVSLDIDIDVLEPPELAARLVALGDYMTQRYS